MVNDVTLRVENWLGLYSFMVAPYDDFEVILNMDFFIKAKVFIMPHMGGILIGDERKPCFLAKTKHEDIVGVILLIQIKTAIKKG